MFSVKSIADLQLRARIIYRADEFSFDTLPIAEDGIASILIDDLNLEINTSGLIVAIWGLCPSTRWVQKNFAPPAAQLGAVIYSSDSPIIEGVSRRINSGSYLPTYFNKSSGWVCIDNGEAGECAIEIISGAILELSLDGALNRVWLKADLVSGDIASN